MITNAETDRCCQPESEMNSQTVDIQISKREPREQLENSSDGGQRYRQERIELYLPVKSMSVISIIRAK